MGKLVKLATIFLGVSSLPAWAGKGIVLVYELDYLSDRSPNAKVIQTAVKGDQIYIHPRHFINSPLERRYEKISDLNLDELESKRADDQGYYETLDNNGNQAWVKKKHVKLVFKDDREARQSISPYNDRNWDPTDYRIEEPIPPDYPLMIKDRKRAFITAGTGPTPRTNYPYRDIVDTEEMINRIGFTLAYMNKVNWDKFDRFYYGGTGHFYGSGAKYQLFDGTIAEESRGEFGAGPIVSYDVWRTEEYKFTTSAALTLNRTRYLVSTKSDSGDEERSFSSWNFTPKLAAFFSWINIIPGSDFIAGADMQMTFGHYLKPNTEPVVEDNWQNDSDEIFIPFGGHMTLFIGVQTHY